MSLWSGPAGPVPVGLVGPVPVGPVGPVPVGPVLCSTVQYCTVLYSRETIKKLKMFKNIDLFLGLTL